MLQCIISFIVLKIEIHTAWERYREWNQEKWVQIYCTEMFTLGQDGDRNVDQLFPAVLVQLPVPVPFRCSVNKPLGWQVPPHPTQYSSKIRSRWPPLTTMETFTFLTLLTDFVDLLCKVNKQTDSLLQVQKGQFILKDVNTLQGLKSATNKPFLVPHSSWKLHN